MLVLTQLPVSPVLSEAPQCEAVPEISTVPEAVTEAEIPPVAESKPDNPETSVSENDPQCEADLEGEPIVPCLVSEDVSSEETADESVISGFLRQSGLVITESHEPQDGQDIAVLAAKIAESLPEAEGFLRSLRTANCALSREFCYPLSGHSEKERTAIRKVADILRRCGVFAGFCPDTQKSIRGKMAECSRVVNFINGAWLEIHCQHLTCQIVREYAEARGLPFEVIANVHIQHEATGEPHEIDLMFSIGEQVFGMEQKSGLNFSDYDRYRKIGEWLGIIPDRFLLLNSNLTEDYAVGCIQYFHRYYISSLANYQKVLKAMLEKNLTK